MNSSGQDIYIVDTCIRSVLIQYLIFQLPYLAFFVPIIYMYIFVYLFYIAPIYSVFAVYISSIDK